MSESLDDPVAAGPPQADKPYTAAELAAVHTDLCARPKNDISIYEDADSSPMLSQLVLTARSGPESLETTRLVWECVRCFSGTEANVRLLMSSGLPALIAPTLRRFHADRAVAQSVWQLCSAIGMCADLAIRLTYQHADALPALLLPLQAHAEDRACMSLAAMALGMIADGNSTAMDALLAAGIADKIRAVAAVQPDNPMIARLMAQLAAEEPAAAADAAAEDASSSSPAAAEEDAELPEEESFEEGPKPPEAFEPLSVEDLIALAAELRADGADLRAKAQDTPVLSALAQRMEASNDKAETSLLAWECARLFSLSAENLWPLRCSGVLQQVAPAMGSLAGSDADLYKRICATLTALARTPLRLYVIVCPDLVDSLLTPLIAFSRVPSALAAGCGVFAALIAGSPRTLRFLRQSDVVHKLTMLRRMQMDSKDVNDPSLRALLRDMGVQVEADPEPASSAAVAASSSSSSSSSSSEDAAENLKQEQARADRESPPYCHCGAISLDDELPVLLSQLRAGRVDVRSRAQTSPVLASIAKRMTDSRADLATTLSLWECARWFAAGLSDGTTWLLQDAELLSEVGPALSAFGAQSAPLFRDVCAVLAALGRTERNRSDVMSDKLTDPLLAALAAHTEDLSCISAASSVFAAILSDKDSAAYQMQYLGACGVDKKLRAVQTAQQAAGLDDPQLTQLLTQMDGRRKA